MAAQDDKISENRRRLFKALSAAPVVATLRPGTLAAGSAYQCAAPLRELDLATFHRPRQYSLRLQIVPAPMLARGAPPMVFSIKRCCLGIRAEALQLGCAGVSWLFGMLCRSGSWNWMAN